jgi:hypothetical protein
MFAFRELLYLGLVAISTGLRCGDFHFGYVLRRTVVFAVASGATYLVLTVFAQFPITDDVRVCFGVTVQAIVSYRCPDYEA